MAQEEHDREDLLREATALVERAQLAVPGWPEPVVAGFRRDGSASFFFGSALVFQFNAAGQLRRAFADELLYKAEAGRLVALRRERNAGQLNLVRHELDAVETAAFLRRAMDSLQSLSTALKGNAYRVDGEVPSNGNVAARIAAWLVEHPGPLEIANSPHVTGR